jgi:hypothetical protein
MAELKELIAKRGVVKRKVTLAEQFCTGFQTGNDIEEIANRINKLSQIYDEFYTLQCRIEFLESEDPRITSSADQAMEFEKHYFRVLSQLQVLSKKFEKNKPQVQI